MKISAMAFVPDLQRKAGLHLNQGISALVPPILLLFLSMVVYLTDQENSLTREGKFMPEAINLSQTRMDNNEGGAFNCVIIKGDTIRWNVK